MNSKVTQITDKIQQKVTIEDPKLGSVEWIIRPLPALVLLEHMDIFNKLAKKSQNFNTEDLSEAETQTVKEEILPMMKAVLPNCIVDPPIAIEDNDPRLLTQDALHLKDLPFKTVMELFNNIMKITGLDKDAEDARKKLESQTSVGA